MADSDIAAPAPPPGPGPAPAPAADTPLTDDERLWGLLAHVLALVGFAVPLFGNLVGPAIAYFVRKDQSKFVRFNAIQSFAFQLTLIVIGVILFIPFMILNLITAGIGLILLVPLAALISLGLLVYVAYMGIRANKGEVCKYPFIGDWAHRKVYEQDWKPV